MAKNDTVSLTSPLARGTRTVSLPANVMRSLRMIARVEQRSVAAFCMEALSRAEGSAEALSDAAHIRATVLRHLAFGGRAADRRLGEPFHL